MSQWRVHYQHRGAPASTVLDGETPQAARTAFQHHYGRNVAIERIEPVGQGQRPTPVARPEPARVEEGGARRASEAEMRQVANGLRALRGQLANMPQPINALPPTCPECGGPAERTWGGRRGRFFIHPLGCGHRNAHPSTAAEDERRARAREVLATSKRGLLPHEVPPLPNPSEQAA